MAQNVIGEINSELQEESTLTNKYLTFALSDETYGIEIAYVTEIVGVTPITFVPEMPHFIKGIINLRGKIIPVLDMRLFFNMEPLEYNERTCFIVVEDCGLMVALAVDFVCEVTVIEDVSEVPEMHTDTQRYMQGIGKMPDGVKLLLDCNMLLGIKELEQEET